MKTSIIWKYNKDDFQNLINNSTSFKDVLKKLNLSIVAGNYKTLNDRIKRDCINLENINLKRTSVRKKLGIRKKFDDNDVFVENSSFHRKHIKERILKQKLIPYICEKCNQNDVWNCEKLVLILDHKNGINNDNRLENLRFLCPNCNSQTETFSGRNTKKKEYICPICNQKYAGFGKCCKKCWLKNQPKKLEISKEKLEDLIINQKKSFLSIAKEYKVSSNTIKKRCSQFNIGVSY